MASPWTAPQIKKARQYCSFEKDGKDDQAFAIWDELDAEIGERRTESLLQYVKESAVQVEAEEPKLEAAEPAEEYDLLPFEIWDPKLQRAVPATGYQIDQYCRPHGSGGRRRKRGPLAHQHNWFSKGKDDARFFHGYVLTINGRRRRVTAYSLALARYHAERKRSNDELEL